ncbi:hypothetical protein OC846_001760 [Tilletia horrida]|uniref:Ima1 N-terminal domain-containing protein n=1 Tax=Tilletia horrida TaxID=155126 RepID=A0AAN6GTJ1_9BASI|nr:hypothetical protein OC846_001760 [Tilletia horrida]
MLANYLPDEEDPTFQTAMSSLPSYRASLLTRYPPVCSNCKPAVDDALSQSNRIAKQEAMRHFLARGKQSAEARSANGAGPGGRTGPGSKWKGKGKATDADSLYLGRVSIFVDAVWLTRGVAWTATNTASLLIPILSLVSLLWTAWNPRWKRIVRLQRRGSDVRLVGQRNWARAHLVLWAMRLCFVAVCWLVLAKPDKSSRLGTSLILFREQVKLHPSMLLWVSLVFIVLQVVLHSYAFRTLKFRYGPRLDWRGKDRNNPDAFAAVSSSTVDPAAAFSTALDFQSSGNPHPASSSIPAFGQAPNGNAANGLDALFERNPAHYPSTNRGAEDRDEEEEDGPSGGRGSDAMDWSPTEEKTEVASHQRAAPRNGFAAWASSSTSPSATATNGSRTPSGSNSSYRGGGSDPPSYGTLGPQRFFVPEQPTGLEDLLLNVLQFGKEEDQGEAVRKETQRSNQSNAGSSWGNWWRRRQ